MQISLTGSRYSAEPTVRRYFQELIGQIQTAPGIESAAAISHLPLSQSTARVEFSIEGHPQNPNEKLKTDLRLISRDYFKTMGIPLLNGRDFGERDNSEAAKVIIINRALAQRYFPDEDPVGKRMMVTIGEPVLREVVGVVGDVKHSGLNEGLMSEVYVPFLQLTFGTMNVVMRTTGDPLEFARAARSYALAVDKDQPVARIKTMEEFISDSVAKPRFNTILLSVFAVLGLIIAITGVYGVTSYSVTQRVPELGIRMALGATHKQVLRLIIGQAIGLASIGVAIGIGGAFALTRILEGELFAIAATDPATFVIVSLVLGGSVLAASYFPAHRATKVDPAIVLRNE
jgi:putative ABC transport system permease protein